MFAPTKTWRKWHRKVNLKEALARVCGGVGVLPLLMARSQSRERAGSAISARRFVRRYDQDEQAIKILKAWVRLLTSKSQASER